MAPKICVYLQHEDPILQTAIRLLLTPADDITYGGEITSDHLFDQADAYHSHVLMIRGGYQGM